MLKDWFVKSVLINCWVRRKGKGQKSNPGAKQKGIQDYGSGESSTRKIQHEVFVRGVAAATGQPQKGGPVKGYSSEPKETLYLGE